MTQKERILGVLKEGGWHSVLELNAICWRYGARLWDLRQEGWNLEKRVSQNTGLEDWRLGDPEKWTPADAPATTPRRKSRQLALPV